MATDLPQLRAWLDALLEQRALDTAQAQQLLVALTDAEVPPALAGALLAAVREKAQGWTNCALALGMRAPRGGAIAGRGSGHSRHRRRQVGQLKHLTGAALRLRAGLPW